VKYRRLVRAITPHHDPFMVNDIRHRMILNPKTAATQQNWWE
jgi:hypothetical protein